MFRASWLRAGASVREGASAGGIHHLCSTLQRAGRSGSSPVLPVSMAWIYVLVASVFEVAWAVGLKYTDGLSRLWPTVATVAAMLASFLFLSLGVRALPVGTAYAVWTGIGAAGTAVLGMLLFGESREAVRIVCLLLIVAGVVGLRLTVR